MKFKFWVFLTILIFPSMFSCQSEMDQVELHAKELLAKEGGLDDYKVEVFRSEDGSFFVVAVYSEKVSKDTIEKMVPLFIKGEVSSLVFPGAIIVVVDRDKETGKLYYGDLEEQIKKLP